MIDKHSREVRLVSVGRVTVGRRTIRAYSVLEKDSNISHAFIYANMSVTYATLKARAMHHVRPRRVRGRISEFACRVLCSSLGDWRSTVYERPVSEFVS